LIFSDVAMQKIQINPFNFHQHDDLAH
jgi:hypothetical protein